MKHSVLSLVLVLPAILQGACGEAQPMPTAVIVARTQTPAAQTTAPSTSQDALKDEWRFAHRGGLLLVNACRMMMETQVNFQRGEIDPAQARSELKREAEVITLVNLQIAKEIPSENTGVLIWELDAEMRSLIETWDRMVSGEIGSPQISALLKKNCASLERTRVMIVKSAVESGLTEASLRELELEIEETLEGLANGGVNE